MRNLLSLFVVFCLVSSKASAQTYTLNNSLNGDTVTTCAGTFVDDGGASSTYTHNQDRSVTFVPATPGKMMRIDFTVLYIAFNDSLIIYDGPNTSSPILVVYDYLNSTNTNMVALNSTGAITIRFKSDNSSNDLGWQATLSCVPPCQQFSGTLTSVPAADANGFVNVCLGDFVTLNTNITYPNNNAQYAQANATSMFRWKTGFSNDTAANNLTSITKRITQTAGYNIRVNVTDANGCNISQELKLKVRTSAKPLFKIAQPAPICLGDTATFTSNYTMATGSFAVPPFSGKSLFLPDGDGVTYTDTIRISDFAPTQTLTNINQFLGVFMTMEHSYLGDLGISLKAPNGTVIDLKKYLGLSHGGGTFLGEPVDLDALANIPGIGYQYGFAPNPSLGTMVSEANNYTHSYTDVAGNTYTSVNYLPAGNYTPESSLNALLGTPLNGNWVLLIKDNWQFDNGYLFSWSLKFANSLYPNQDNYQIGAKTLAWSSVLPSGNLVNANGTTATVSPTVTNFSNFKFTITDSANCVYDTTVRVLVNPRPVKPNLGADKIMCATQNFNLSASNIAGGVQYSWNTGSTSSNINVNQLGTYILTVSNVQGCKSSDTVLIQEEPGLLLDLGTDTMFCASSPNILLANTSANFTGFVWDDGSTGLSRPITAPGLYWIEGTSINGCVKRDSINVTNNPINTWQMPADVTTCGAATLVSVTNAPTGTTLTWFDNTTGNDYNFTSPGNYTTIANYIGCLKQDDINIVLNPVPQVSLGNDTMFCASNPNVLQAATTGIITGYEWNDGSTSATLPITATGTYWLEVTSDMGCTARDSINITNNPINNWQTPADVDICGTGYIVTLDNYPAGTSFTWDDGLTGVTHSYTSSGNYGVTADYIGCLKQDGIDVGIHPFPIVNLGNDTMFCASNPNVLQSNITGNISTLEWNTGANTPTLPITTTGTYWLEATTAFGCKHRDSIIITANPINSWQTPNDSSICDESVHTIELDNYPAGTDFTWYDGSKDPSHEINAAGTFDVTADYIGCLKEDDITIGLRPLPVVEVGRDTTLCYGFTVPLKVSYPGASYAWSNGKTDSSIIANKQDVWWVETTLNGCTYIDSLYVTYVDCSCNTSVPNAFSPNGDGLNDVLKVHIECLPNRYQFSMFNRYGQPVFETRDLKQGWDGKVNGSDATVGTYYYILTYFNESLQRNELFKGYVVLVK